MKSSASVSLTLMLVGGLALATSAGDLTTFEASGSGTVETNCLVTLAPGCTATATGTVSGTPLVAGTFTFRVDTGSPVSLNGYPAHTVGIDGASQGICVPGSFVATLAQGDDTIELAHVGTVCEEAQPGSAYHYQGTYRVTGGTGRFVAAAGAGTLVGTFTRDTATAHVYLRGAISY